MGAVDKCDQLLKPCSSGRKCLAWFKKLALHMINRMVLNTFKVFKNTRQGDKRTLLDFIREVAKDILKE